MTGLPFVLLIVREGPAMGVVNVAMGVVGVVMGVVSVVMGVVDVVLGGLRTDVVGVIGVVRLMGVVSS